jgi:esterase/lipase superfamily enzyme
MGLFEKDQHDVFFGFASGDNTGNWIKDFCDDLKARVLVELNADAFNDDFYLNRIDFFVTDIPATGGLADETIRVAIKKSDFLFMFVGESYLNSEYFVEEFEWFSRRFSRINMCMVMLTRSLVTLAASFETREIKCESAFDDETGVPIAKLLATKEGGRGGVNPKYTKLVNKISKTLVRRILERRVGPPAAAPQTQVQQQKDQVWQPQKNQRWQQQVWHNDSLLPERRAIPEDAAAASEPLPIPRAAHRVSEPRTTPRAAPPAERNVEGDYVVWYGTNRRPRSVSDITQGYSSERDIKVHYGSCKVYVPQSHKIGSLGSSFWKRLITRTDDRLKLREIKEFGGTAFWRRIASRLAKARVSERHAVIFVHGYNVSFNDAALRAAQIGFDLAIKGAMAFFSWPSQGTLGGYMADAATIEASEQDISNFMIDFVTRSGAEAVHIIAHSMGNRGVLRAVNRIAERAQQRSGVPFGQVILAAADVDSDTFRQLSGAYTRVARRTTLYVSERDRAVEASHWLHQFPRVGLMPPVCVTRDIDTIAVTNADLTLLGHGYIGEARGVLTDIHQLITTGSSPDRRFGLSEAMTLTGERYWLIRT